MNTDREITSPGDEWINISGFIPGFKDYWGNAKGEILSCRQTKTGIILRPGLNEKGYPVVVLYGDHGKRTFKVHNLIAAIFLGPRPEGLVTRHRDGNQLNNVPSNLVYGTHSQNNFDQVAHGVHFEANRTACDVGHEFTPENSMWRYGKGGKTSGIKYRKCKECHRIAIAKYRARRKAGLTPTTD